MCLTYAKRQATFVRPVGAAMRYRSGLGDGQLMKWMTADWLLIETPTPSKTVGSWLAWIAPSHVPFVLERFERYIEIHAPDDTPG